MKIAQKKAIRCLMKVTKKNEKNQNETNMNEEEFEWIKWKRNSCRYDAFFTVFCLGLLNQNEQEFKTNQINNDVFYKEQYQALVETALQLNEGNFSARFNFWNYLSRPIHPSQTG